MVIKVGALGDKKLFENLLLPSWLSGFTAITVSIALIGLTIAFTHFGNTVYLSILGLRNVYSQSTIGTSVQTIGNNFAGSTTLNNALLFLLWGTVGLMVYSVVQGLLKEFGRGNLVLRELHYVNADRHKIMRGAMIREGIKIAAFITWWVLFRYFIFKLVPYTIAAAHVSALHATNPSDWLHCLLAGALCAVVVHVLTILMRLSVLRARVFGQDIEE